MSIHDILQPVIKAFQTDCLDKFQDIVRYQQELLAALYVSLRIQGFPHGIP